MQRVVMVRNERMVEWCASDDTCRFAAQVWPRVGQRMAITRLVPPTVTRWACWHIHLRAISTSVYSHRWMHGDRSMALTSCHLTIDAAVSRSITGLTPLYRQQISPRTAVDQWCTGLASDRTISIILCRHMCHLLPLLDMHCKPSGTLDDSKTQT